MRHYLIVLTLAVYCFPCDNDFRSNEGCYLQGKTFERDSTDCGCKKKKKSIT
jgi:hypothetical protein